MEIKVINSPSKKFTPYVLDAANFYSNELITKRLSQNIYLEIKFNSDLDVYGYSSIEGYNDSNKAREFLIELNSVIGAKEILRTLAHEMVHIKQYAYNETNETLSRWRGIKVDYDAIEYYSQPWELEAMALEVGLFTRYVKKCKLWNVFEELCDPESPIVPIALGWKKVKCKQQKFKIPEGPSIS